MHAWQGVLVSCGCCNKLPPTGWVKTAIFTVSQFWRPEAENQGLSRAALPLKALGEDPSLLLPPSCGPRRSLACGASLQSPPLSSQGLLPVSVLFFSYKDILIGYRAQPNPLWSHLNSSLTVSAKTLFPMKVTF